MARALLRLVVGCGWRPHRSIRSSWPNRQVAPRVVAMVSATTTEAMVPRVPKRAPRQPWRCGMAQALKLAAFAKPNMEGN